VVEIREYFKRAATACLAATAVTLAGGFGTLALSDAVVDWQRQANGSITSDPNAKIILAIDSYDLDLLGQIWSADYPHAKKILGKDMKDVASFVNVVGNLVREEGPADQLIILAHGNTGKVFLGEGSNDRNYSVELLMQALERKQEEIQQQTGQLLAKRIVLASCLVAAVDPRKPETALTLARLRDFSNRLQTPIEVSTTLVTGNSGHFVEVTPNGEINESKRNVPFDLKAYRAITMTRDDGYLIFDPFKQQQFEASPQRPTLQPIPSHSPTPKQ
jgi:hypothetical protein